jgi:hypothetical protein
MRGTREWGQVIYMVDLCDEPVNHLDFDGPERLGKRRSGELRLASELGNLQKGARVVVVMTAINTNVRNALARCGRRDLSLDRVLPFPARWQRNIDRYVRGLSDFLRENCP